MDSVAGVPVLQGFHPVCYSGSRPSRPTARILQEIRSPFHGESQRQRFGMLAHQLGRFLGRRPISRRGVIIL